LITTGTKSVRDGAVDPMSVESDMLDCFFVLPGDQTGAGQLSDGSYDAD
jgi:hypothetical protein